MVSPLFGLNPPNVYSGMVIGVVVVAIVVGIFVMATAKKDHKAQNERNRRAGLGLLAIICGPIAGAGLACLTCTLGDVHPLDVRNMYVVLTIIGCIAGFIAAIIFAALSLLAPRNPRVKTTAPEPTDEL
jgi:MFS family permease